MNGKKVDPLKWTGYQSTRLLPGAEGLSDAQRGGYATPGASGVAQPKPGITAAGLRAAEGFGGKVRLPQIPGARMLNKIVPRAGVYAGIPALQWYLGQLTDAQKAKQQLDQLAQGASN